MADDVVFSVTRGEDYSAYIEWLDERDNPVTIDERSTAMMQVRAAPGDDVLLEFTSAATLGVTPSATVLGESGVIMLVCPKLFTQSVDPGTYMCDLFVKHFDAEALAFPDGQHHRLLRGGFKVEERITVTSEGGAAPDPTPPSQIARFTIGDGVQTTYTVSHFFNTFDVDVTVYSVLTGEDVGATVTRISTAAVTVGFASPPLANSCRVIITRKA